MLSHMSPPPLPPWPLGQDWPGVEVDCFQVLETPPPPTVGSSGERSHGTKCISMVSACSEGSVHMPPVTDFPTCSLQVCDCPV